MPDYCKKRAIHFILVIDLPCYESLDEIAYFLEVNFVIDNRNSLFMSVSSELASGIEEKDLGLAISRPQLKLREDITTAQRMISACSGSFITSLVVTPFDVIRIRIQQQEILPSGQQCCQVQLPPVTSRNTLVKNPVLAAAETSELFWMNEGYCKSAENCSKINSTFQGFLVISRNEGLPTLWRGLTLTLFMAIPSNIIYFTGYEYIRDHSPITNHPLNPLFCGASARTMAATFVAPVELLKTRLQSIPSDLKNNNNNSTILKTLLSDSYHVVRKRGISTLFTGLQITLWRDVPFSGIYWLCYERFKTSISSLLHADFDSHRKNEDWKLFTTSFLSGSISGTIAAFFTNPFDVGKTRLQITTQQAHEKGEKIKKPSMFKFLINIYKNEGIEALYSGFGPRVMKIAPSCAIMISSYEIGKKIFKHGNVMN